MFCGVCKKDLEVCTCADKEERVKAITSSPKLLIIKYLSEFHGPENGLKIETYYTLLRILEDAPSLETIRRLRQRFQEDGLYMGTKRLKRLEEEKRVRQVVRRRSL